MARTYADMSKSREFGGDKVCITRMLADIPGGVVLDTTGYKDEVIKEGQVIAYNATSDVYKPLAVSGNAYGTAESGFVPVGVVITTVPASEPFVGVMTMGQMVKARCPYTMSDEVVKALPHINLI